MKEYKSTSEMLHDRLQMCGDVPECNGWIGVAGYRMHDSYFTVYKAVDGSRYCVHAGEEWNKDEEPYYGYFSIDLTWDELIDQVAARYDDVFALHRAQKAQKCIGNV